MAKMLALWLPLLRPKGWPDNAAESTSEDEEMKKARPRTLRSACWPWPKMAKTKVVEKDRTGPVPFDPEPNSSKGGWKAWPFIFLVAPLVSMSRPFGMTMLAPPSVRFAPAKPLRANCRPSSLPPLPVAARQQ
ncbi:hypothetical protein VPH35_018958 [Triticum aestivum]